MANFETEIEVNDVDVEVVVEYEYEFPCGDGWHEPRWPEQVNIYGVTDKAGNDVEFTKGHEAWLMEEISEHIHREAAEREADRAEYIYEAHQDFLMDR